MATTTDNPQIPNKTIILDMDYGELQLANYLNDSYRPRVDYEVNLIPLMLKVIMPNRTDHWHYHYSLKKWLLA